VAMKANLLSKKLRFRKLMILKKTVLIMRKMMLWMMKSIKD